ncbi:MAG: helix-turn-helix domain-containing protein [Nitriliruptoraceae bacterium]
MTNTTLRLAESLLDRPYVTAKHVTREFDVTAPTAQKAIDSLVDEGILTEVTGRKRNRVYRSPRIMDVVYGVHDDPATARLAHESVRSSWQQQRAAIERQETGRPA